ncbi:acyl carrier protein [Actinomadura fibrosa]|uniref:Acyl carrier protein n=1 Tax=Actinomadura fibrosa TaxID=111802 RepID=A0ABW2XGJ2_9ACTN|nr:acyl carrier protein [Actinomadura fibrosa]
MNDTSRVLPSLVAEDAGMAPADLCPQDTLEDLGLDSLMLVRLRLRIERETGVWLDELELNTSTTMEELARLVSARSAGRA